jgi:hypothetical protein
MGHASRRLAAETICVVKVSVVVCENSDLAEMTAVST